MEDFSFVGMTQMTGPVATTGITSMQGKPTADIDTFLNSGPDHARSIGVYRDDDQVVDASLVKHRGAWE
jgi:hypothetical protein